MAANEGFNVPTVATDALVEIFLRLLTSAWRRFRLVCKLCRDLVDRRAHAGAAGPDPDPHLHQPWVEVPCHRVRRQRRAPQARVVLRVGHPRRRRHGRHVQHGLICLHDYGDRFVITVANPITGEAWRSLHTPRRGTRPDVKGYTPSATTP
ncbi:unnamed protein product [Urochloa humidicola]